jgi:hypothetical protein
MLLLVALIIVLEGLDFEESFLLSVATQGSYGSWKKETAKTDIERIS